MTEHTRLTAWVHGHVQGVGFRWWTRLRALELGLTGYASNQPDGRVLVVAQGRARLRAPAGSSARAGTRHGRQRHRRLQRPGEPMSGFRER